MQNNATHKKNSQSLPEKNETSLTRRELLVGIMASVGVMSTLGCVDNFEKSVTNPSTTTSSGASNLKFYSQEQFKLITILANLIIPDTDTLGAVAVGVPTMMDTLHAEWASSESKEKHSNVVSKLSKELNNVLGSDFLVASEDKQIEVLSNYDQQAFSNKKNESWGYRSVKSLIAQFYYLSEEGATKELRYELVPGRWEACVPFEKIGRTWAA
ncbi:gluconate 2-dehydrogenase subunit 3 family protein [Paraglaciecola sp.]|uniref:gluconate 2-dehydrogenase subunit 3 family protein n=1 Tax=Paraglaciecola sp. TaxID=1920173 RepID=UPI003EFA4A87